MSDIGNGTIKEAAQGLNKGAEVNTDNRFNEPTAKERHEAAYTDILDAYIDNVKKTVEVKQGYKSKVFWLAIVLLIAVFLLLCGLLIWVGTTEQEIDIAERCSLIIPAMVSFLTVFIVIPRVITEYLFNSEEEKYMSEIIKNIQTYDKDQNRD